MSVLIQPESEVTFAPEVATVRSNTPACEKNVLIRDNGFVLMWMGAAQHKWAASSLLPTIDVETNDFFGMGCQSPLVALHCRSSGGVMSHLTAYRVLAAYSVTLSTRAGFRYTQPVLL